MIKTILALAIMFLVFTGISFAQENSPTPISTPAPTPVKYDLAFPGMLPDHPFYKLKVLRDKITLFLIKDTEKKANHHLLLADKRIHMAAILVDKGEIELAKETALKGENEYTNLVNLYKDSRKKPKKETFGRLETASIKHQEILNKILEKVETKDKETFKNVIWFSTLNLEELRKVYKYY